MDLYFGPGPMDPSWYDLGDTRLSVDLPELPSGVGPSTPIADVLRDRDAGIVSVAASQPSSTSSGLAGIASPFLAAVGAIASGTAGVLREKLRLDAQRDALRSGGVRSWWSGLSPTLQAANVQSLMTWALVGGAVIVVFLLFSRSR